MSDIFRRAARRVLGAACHTGAAFQPPTPAQELQLLMIRGEVTFADALRITESSVNVARMAQAVVVKAIDLLVEQAREEGYVAHCSACGEAVEYPPAPRWARPDTPRSWWAHQDGMPMCSSAGNTSHPLPVWVRGGAEGFGD